MLFWQNWIGRGWTLKNGNKRPFKDLEMCKIGKSKIVLPVSCSQAVQVKFICADYFWWILFSLCYFSGFILFFQIALLIWIWFFLVIFIYLDSASYVFIINSFRAAMVKKLRKCSEVNMEHWIKKILTMHLTMKKVHKVWENK